MKVVVAWFLCCLLMAVCSYAIQVDDLQFLTLIAAMFLLPCPVMVSTRDLSRSSLAAVLPLLSMFLSMCATGPAKTPGDVEFGPAVALSQIIPLALASALCAPPYRLLTWMIQTGWAGFLCYLSYSRGYLPWSYSLTLGLLSPLLFLATAAVARIHPSLVADESRSFYTGVGSAERVPTTAGIELVAGFLGVGMAYIFISARFPQYYYASILVLTPLLMLIVAARYRHRQRSR